MARFIVGDAVLVVDNTYSAVAPPVGPAVIEDIDEDDDYLIDGQWYRETDVRAVPTEPLPALPTVPAPPKFSSVEEAEAWMEQHANDEPDPFAPAPNRWLVKVFRPNGSLAFQVGAELIHRTDPEDIRAVLSEALIQSDDIPF